MANMQKKNSDTSQSKKYSLFLSFSLSILVPKAKQNVPEIPVKMTNEKTIGELVFMSISSRAKSKRPQTAKKPPNTIKKIHPAMLMILMNLMSSSEMPLRRSEGFFFSFFDMIRVVLNPYYYFIGSSILQEDDRLGNVALMIL